MVNVKHRKPQPVAIGLKPNLVKRMGSAKPQIGWGSLLKCRFLVGVTLVHDSSVTHLYTTML